MPEFHLKAVSSSEFQIASEWAAAEGWNPGHNDVALYHTADPSGFFLGYLNEEPIAAISAVRYDDAFGFLGFYIVKPEHRGNGYGLQIWNRAMQHLEGCNVGLDGVVDQQANYQKSGFTLEHANQRFEGTSTGQHPHHPNLVPLSNIPAESITRYAAAFFPSERSKFMHQWLKQRNSHALGILAHGKLAGLVLARPCQTGFKIGPLFADSPEIAESLFLAAQSKLTPGTPIFLDIPATNPLARDLVTKHRMHCSFDTARMYTGTAPDIALERTYGITSFEIG